MAGCTEPSWKQLSRNNEGSGIWAEVGEEECTSKEKHKNNISLTDFTIMIVKSGNGDQDNSQESETHDLDAPSPKSINQKDCTKVSRNCGAYGKDSLQLSYMVSLLKRVEGIKFVGEVGFVYTRLGEVAAVEDNVEEEPRSCAGEEISAMTTEEML